jgi:quercetin dioxygenase-like cupin family protein
MRRWVLSIVALAAGAMAAGPPSPQVTVLPAEQVRAAFAKGMPLLENDVYKVHASRREAAGQAEVHTRDTDVIYVLEGSGTLVTGGRVVGARSVAPEEIRGASLAGGTSHALAPGDVVVVPNGVPHWFEEVRGPLLYYVVKVTAAETPR